VDPLRVLLDYRHYIASILETHDLRFEDPLPARDPQLEALFLRHQSRYADPRRVWDFVLNTRIMDLVSRLEGFRRPVLQACGQLGISTPFLGAHLDALALALGRLIDLPACGARRERAHHAALEGVDQPLRALDDIIALAQGRAARQQKVRARGANPAATPLREPVQTTEATPLSVEQVAACLDDVDWSILRGLQRHAGRLPSQGQIAAMTKRPVVARSTISERMPRLEILQLVHRPQGVKRGYALTDRGRAVLAAQAQQ
jgi:hypothetical protein